MRKTESLCSFVSGHITLFPYPKTSPYILLWYGVTGYFNECARDYSYE